MTDKRTPRKRKPPVPTETRIVDTALDEADRVGWSNLQLSDVAASLKISLAEIESHFRDKDAVANALFQRAWQAMLQPTPEDFPHWRAQDRLYFLLMRWFDALASHRTVAVEMLQGKLYPSHPHHWVPMVFNLSRTIHWLRDAALLDAGGRRGQLEEIGLSGLFLRALWVWARDDRDNQERTRAWLEDRLARADRLMARLFRNRAD